MHRTLWNYLARQEETQRAFLEQAALQIYAIRYFDAVSSHSRRNHGDNARQFAILECGCFLERENLWRQIVLQSGGNFVLQDLDRAVDEILNDGHGRYREIFVLEFARAGEYLRKIRDIILIVDNIHVPISTGLKDIRIAWADTFRKFEREQQRKFTGPTPAWTWAVALIPLGFIVMPGLGETGLPAWLVFLPSLSTMACGLLTQRTVLSLVVGILMAILLKIPTETTNDPLQSRLEDFLDQVRTIWISPDQWGLIGITLLSVTLVTLLQSCGAFHALAKNIKPTARRTSIKRNALLVSIGTSLVDDAVGIVFSGAAYSGSFERLHIARERLAHLTHTIGVGVAAISPMSVWFLYLTGLAGDAILVFASMAFRFYALSAIGIAIIALFANRRNFTRMNRCIERENRIGKVPRRQHPVLRSVLDRGSETSSPFWLALGVAVVGIVFLQAELGGVEAAHSAYSSCFAFVLAAAVLLALGSIIASQSLEVAALPSVAWIVLNRCWLPCILLCLGMAFANAWSKDEIGIYFDQLALMQNRELLPAVAFVAASIVSSSTGTAWGAMGLVMPLLPSISGELSLNEEFWYSALMISAVVDGAVFGDNVSPLSDTTTLSATSCGVSDVDHVATQFPYSCLAWVIAGTLYVVAGLMI